MKIRHVALFGVLFFGPAVALGVYMNDEREFMGLGPLPWLLIGALFGLFQAASWYYVSHRPDRKPGIDW